MSTELTIMDVTGIIIEPIHELKKTKSNSRRITIQTQDGEISIALFSDHAERLNAIEFKSSQ